MAGQSLPGQPEKKLSAGKQNTAGATPGKLVCGLRVIALGGGSPGLVRSTVRNALRLVDGLPAFNILGIVLILTSEERAWLGDRLGRTRVVIK